MDLCILIDELARRQGVRHSPDWLGSVQGSFDSQDESAIDQLCAKLNWHMPSPITDKPRATEFPFLVYRSEIGWVIAEQWINKDQLRVFSDGASQSVEWHPNLPMFRLMFPEISKENHYTKAKDVFWALILKRKRMLIEAVVATVVLSFLSLMTSLYSMQVYDRVVPHSGFSTLWVLTVGVAIGLVIDLVLRSTRSMMVDRETAKIDAEVSEYFFSRAQSIRLDARPKSVGTMAAQLRSIDQIRLTMTSTTLLVLADLPFAFFFIAVIASIGSDVAIVPLVIFIISILLAFVFARLIREEAAHAQSTSYSKNGLLVEVLDAAETIKANLGGWQMLRKWTMLVDENNHHDTKVRRWSVFATSIFGFLQQLAYIGMVAWGAYKISDGSMTMGGLIACTIIGGRVNGTLITSLPNMIVQWSYTRSALKSLDALLELPGDHPHDRQMLKIKEINPHLKVMNAKFLHAGARVGIDVATLEVSPGEKVGLVGPVGSGKSSLLRLFAGLYAPQEGHILLDGIDISHIAEEDLRSNIFYFPQDYRLVQGTLRDNLTMGLPSCTDEVLIDCANRTGLAQLIRMHPKGLDLPIAEGGQGLSGGQKVLVGLTRLLLAKPRLVLLDEPTANLDQETELKVLNAMLMNLSTNTTLVFVTHRMQLLGIFSRLMVMGQGRILLDGPTKDVIEQLKAKAPQASATAASSSNPDIQLQ